jgi:hypothetical protein
LAQKSIPFSEFDHYILATLCVYLACKIDNIQITYQTFQKFYHENKNLKSSAAAPVEAAVASEKLTAAQRMKARLAAKKNKE